jgi:4-amino-4-deoxy-L-arabinose transferase-like glycosyltransferase
LVARLVVAIFGALAVPCVYGLVRELRLPAAAPAAALVAALSPWQIFLSRVSIPPALVATCWTLCLWAAIRFVRAGRRRDAIWLAIAAGIGLYAYPSMKLAVPLLLAVALALALWRHGWRAGWRWWPAALALGLLWSPFAASTLLNPDSGARLQLIEIKATSPGEWLATWWSNYTVYFQPNLYYLAGGIRKIAQGMPDHGVALGAEMPLLLGLLGLPVLALTPKPADDRSLAGAGSTPALVPLQIWLLIAGALLIAPLPASLTLGHPHAFRASMLAPVYAVLVGIGAAVEWQLLGRLPARAGALVRVAGTLAALGKTAKAIATYVWLLQFKTSPTKDPCWESQEWADSLKTDCFFRLGVCFRQSGENKNAEHCFQQYSTLLLHGFKGSYCMDEVCHQFRGMHGMKKNGVRDRELRQVIDATLNDLGLSAIGARTSRGKSSNVDLGKLLTS